MSLRSELIRNERGADVNWFKGGKDLFMRQPWARSENYVQERFDISPNTTSLAYGTTIEFDVDKRMDLLGRMELYVTRGALSGATMFNDFECYASIDKVAILYNNKSVFEVRGDELMKRFQEKHPRTRAVLAKQGNGYLTGAELNASAAASTSPLAVIWTDLDMPWKDFHRRLPMVGLPNPIKVQVTFRALADFVTTTGTPACTMTDCKLRCWGEHLLEAKRSAVFSQTRGASGVVFKVSNTENHYKEQIAASTTEARINLRNFKNATYQMNCTLRTLGQVDTASTRDLYKNLVLPTGYVWLEDQNARITDKIILDSATLRAYDVYQYNHRQHPDAVLGLPVIRFAFCDPKFVDASDTGCYGSKNFNKTGNPQLVIQWATNSGSSIIYADIEARIHNLIIVKQGDLRRFLL
jgi:hypothetical protein